MIHDRVRIIFLEKMARMGEHVRAAVMRPCRTSANSQGDRAALVEEGRRRRSSAAPVRRGAEAADAVCARLRLIQHATSLGAVESTVERRASVPGQEHLPFSLLRLSVGIEGVEDLWADLDRALRVAVEA
jgi:hypothetical protein